MSAGFIYRQYLLMNRIYHMKENAVLPYSSSKHESSSYDSQILSIGTATAKRKYTQHEVVDMFEIDDPRKRAIFTNSAIKERGLSLPDAPKQNETQAELLAKHRKQAVAMGSEAIQKALSKIDAKISDIKYLCCVTSTGFLAPGVSALIC
jgi:predicted naringenin-chalcone synthase